MFTFLIYFKVAWVLVSSGNQVQPSFQTIFLFLMTMLKLTALCKSELCRHKNRSFR